MVRGWTSVASLLRRLECSSLTRCSHMLCHRRMLRLGLVGTDVLLWLGLSLTVLGVLFCPFSIHKYHKIISISSVWVSLTGFCQGFMVHDTWRVVSFTTTLNVFLPFRTCLCTRETRHKWANEWRGREEERKREVCGMGVGVGGGHLWDECRLLALKSGALTVTVWAGRHDSSTIYAVCVHVCVSYDATCVELITLSHWSSYANGKLICTV